MRTRSKSFRADARRTLAAGPIRRLDLITGVCRLPTELLVVLEPRKFLDLVEQSISDARITMADWWNREMPVIH